MKYNILVKAIAILLAACAMVVGVAGAFGIALLSYMDMYNATDYTAWQEAEIEDRSSQLAYRVAEEYCYENLSRIPAEVTVRYAYLWQEWEYESWIGILPNSYSYAIYSQSGTLLEEKGQQAPKGLGQTFTVQVDYPVQTERDFADEIWHIDGREWGISWKASPVYTVRVYMTAKSLTTYQGLAFPYIDTLFSLRYWLIVALVGSLAVFAVCAVYLCMAAGRKPGTEEIRPGGLNRMPLDLYLAVCAGAVTGLLALAWLVLEHWVVNASANVGALTLVVLAGLVSAVMIVGWFFALVAQVKLGRTWWLRHTVIGTVCVWIFRGLRFVFRAVGKLISLLPMIWQYVLAVVAMAFALLFAIVISANADTGFAAMFLVHTILACLALVVYGGYALGTLLKGARRMRRGDLEQKISTRFLFGAYRKAAEDLNSLADAARIAAEKQLKSERMKTELITNVSHDIKTPLTSVINYVDLLQKPHTPQEEQQYLEVLSRQSLRMKKLLDDLMEMSKAATGNVSVELRQVDAAEAVNQALGEFADKLSGAGLTTVYYPPTESVYMCADGKLTWRVLSNLLSNAVKYAQPGTRVYADIQNTAEQVQISLKNISREPLNMTAEELMERFVRGDASRNTEGSGLGLNIARSLMELQGGRLALLVDGDLFKVTLTFPRSN